MNELTTTERRDGFLAAPQSATEAMAFCEMLARSSLVPKGYHNQPGDIMVACQMGAEVGLSPMQSLQNIAVINGRPSVWGDAILGIIQAHPDYVSHEEINASDAFTGGGGRCVIRRSSRKTGEVTEHVGAFTVEDAKRAGLLNKAGPWTNYPGRMLQVRARAFAARDGFADALRGLHISEELQDYEVVATPQAGTSVMMPRRRSTGEAAPESRHGSTEVTTEAVVVTDDEPRNVEGDQSFVVVDVNEQTKGDKTWHVVTIRASNGGLYDPTTFSTSMADAAIALIGKKAFVNIVEKESKGRTYLQLTGIEEAF